MYKAYLIDLDGTAYLGEEVIESCVRFVNKLVEKQIPFLFLTNNSSASSESVCNKLQAMGYDIKPKHIYSSGMACAKYISENYQDPKVYSIGDMGLNKELINHGIELVSAKSDIVVIGYQPKVTYENLANACLEINNGAIFISTNPDRGLPSPRGILPGNGATAAFIEYATGVAPITIGKPSSIIVDYAIKILGFDKKDIALIGDNYDTDIMTGINSKIDTIYVETGLSTKEEVLSKKVLPTIMVKNLDEYEI